MTMWRSYPKSRTEYRIICSNPNHKMHCYEKRTRASAQKAIDRLNEEEMPDVISHRDCKPWQIESRMVSAWEDVGQTEH